MFNHANARSEAAAFACCLAALWLIIPQLLVI